MNKPSTDFFAGEHARRYDERNSKLTPISQSLHFLMGLVLEDLPEHAKILSVGAGTGAEIIALARAFPAWSFVAVEPSASMLDICRERMQNAGLVSRCELVHGFAHDLPPKADFDAATALFVAHFVERDARLGFFENIARRLRPGGYLVNAEISAELDGEAFPSMLRNWRSVQRLMGATPESLDALPQQLKEVLTVLSPAETESTLHEAGLGVPIRFFQAFMISAWYSVKS